MIRTAQATILVCVTLALAACNSSDAPESADSGDMQTRHNRHDHPSEGPHGGELIELGNDEYHAELMHPEPNHEDGIVTVYILDANATDAVLIEAAEIRLNVRHEGQGRQFMLTALPEEGGPEGQSSRFVSSDADLLDLFHEESIEGQLVVDIRGKQYRGDLEHDHADHEHEGHDHE